MIERDLLLVLTLKDLRVRYRSTVLGYLWAVLPPALNAGVLATAFASLGVRVPDGGWGAFLIGVASWQWFAGVIASAPSLYLRNATLVSRMPARWGHHASAAVICEAAPLAAILPLAACASLLFPPRCPLSGWVAFPLLFVAQAVALSGWACFGASLNLLARDAERAAGPLAMALFFITPVAYAPEALQPEVRKWLVLNPAAVFVEAWRAAFIGALSASQAAAIAAHAAAGVVLLAAVTRAARTRLSEFA